MRIARRGETYDYHNHTNRAQISVASGEVFLAESELASGPWLHTHEDTWTPEKTLAHNPTVCVEVLGAKAGDMLAVDILDVVPDTIGYTGFGVDSNPLASRIRLHAWGLNTRTVRIENGMILWSDRIQIPIRPMVGTLGTAPAHEALANIKGGSHGGNMDIQEIEKGARVYLPVEVDGALLHIGDCHAIQGDGEICNAGGIECRADVTIRATVMPRPRSYQGVRIENANFLMTAACGRTVEESFEEASGHLLAWIAEDFDLSIEETYLLMGQVMEARNTQFVNPTFSYLCKMPKWILEKAGKGNNGAF